LEAQVWQLAAGEEAFSPSDASQLTRLLADDGPVLWVHLAREGDFVEYARQASLPQLLITDIAAERRRTRAYELPGYVALTLVRPGVRAAQTLESGGLGDQLERLYVLIARGWALTVGELSEPEREELGQRAAQRRAQTEGMRGELVLSVLVAWCVEEYEHLSDAIDLRFDGLEDEIISPDHHEMVRGLFRLKQSLVALRRQLNAFRETLGQLAADEASLLDPPVERQLRIAHSEVIYSLEHLDAYRDILTAALELNQSVVSNRLNEVMRRLTLIATIFMPITFITGFFGMNFEQIPFASAVWFGMAVASMPASLALLWLVLRNWE